MTSIQLLPLLEDESHIAHGSWLNGQSKYQSLSSDGVGGDFHPRQPDKGLQRSATLCDRHSVLSSVRLQRSVMRVYDRTNDLSNSPRIAHHLDTNVSDRQGSPVSDASLPKVSGGNKDVPISGAEGDTA